MAKEGILLNDNPAAFLLYISAGGKKYPRTEQATPGLNITAGALNPCASLTPAWKKQPHAAISMIL